MHARRLGTNNDDGHDDNDDQDHKEVLIKKYSSTSRACRRETRVYRINHVPTRGRKMMEHWPSAVLFGAGMWRDSQHRASQSSEANAKRPSSEGICARLVRRSALGRVRPLPALCLRAKLETASSQNTESV